MQQEAHQDGDHGEAAVLDLLDLELLEDLRVVGQAQRVEGAARVQVVQAIEDVAVELADAGRVASRAAAIFPDGMQRVPSGSTPFCQSVKRVRSQVDQACTDICMLRLLE